MTLTVFLLTSCQPEEKTATNQTQPQETAPEQHQPQAAPSNSHSVTAQQVIQGASYSYIEVKEDNELYWIATKKTEVASGDEFTFADAMRMANFTSKELQRTFDVIYFVGSIDKGTDTPTDHAQMAIPAGHPPIDAPDGHSSTDPHQKKPAAPAGPISVEPAEGSVSIGELFTSRDSHADKTIRIRGQVTKVNTAIMGKNWIHLKDGTGGPGTNDLLVTTDATAAVGDIVTFEGTITLNKDFGSGYRYELIMEKAKLIN
jgi:hypothetical protein